MKRIELEVARAHYSDVDNELIRIYESSRNKIGIPNEEMLYHPLVKIVYPKNKKKVVVRVSVALEGQEDETKVYMNWTIRARLGVRVGDKVFVSKASGIDSIKYRLGGLKDSVFFGIIFALVILLSDASRFMISEINPEMNLLLVMFYGDIFGILVWTLIYLLVRKLK